MRCFVALLLFSFFWTSSTQAQLQNLRRLGGSGGGMGGRFGGGGGMRGGGGGNDSLSFEKRNFADDSVNVRFRYLDTARYSGFDSSINDFYKRIPLKPDLIHIGHNGNATRPILFAPLRKPGWDAGFHALDPYALTIADTRFMNTTKPYTELGYLVGSLAEQQVSILHTQNASPDLNFVLQYRLVNAPGTFNSQSSSHNNIRFNADYTSKDQRYRAFLILLSNKLQSSENGGIESEDLLVNPNPAYDDRFNIPTNLAKSAYSARNFFNVKLVTGNLYREKTLLFRQQYDFGKKDSVETDSSVVRFFLPRLRMEHTVQSSNHQYTFFDVQSLGSASFYKTNYRFALVPDTVNLNYGMRVLKNDFSLIQFPDPKNPLQFFKLGLSLYNYTTSPDSLRDRFSNVMVHGEYRNRTKNRKWDMLLYGEFYTVGRDAGNYHMQARLQRSLGPKLGALELGFQNINRSPSYLLAYRTPFPVRRPASLNDENVTAINGSLFIQPISTRVTVEYFLQSNYTYLAGFDSVAQYAPLFNYARAGINKTFTFQKKWKWHLDLYLQTAAGNVPINLPWLYTRNRIGYEGKPFRNLELATGLELRYFSSYYADGYSPVLGQFFYQTTRKVISRPDIAYYLHFRIRSFTAYVRLENLNTATTQYGFGFKRNNIASPLYPNPGLVFRLGVFWNFVN